MSTLAAYILGLVCGILLASSLLMTCERREAWHHGCALQFGQTPLVDCTPQVNP